MLFDFAVNIPVLPIATVVDIDSTLLVVDLLIKNGYNTFEITLRSDNAIDCLDSIKKQYPELILGVGSVLSVEETKLVNDHGADFIVSPCIDVDIIQYCLNNKIKYIPGFTTATELHLCLKFNLKLMKFFPANYIKGPLFLKAILEPFKKKDFSIIPTGGIKPDDIPIYLDVNKVNIVGLSYIVDNELIKKRKFNELDNRMKLVAGIFKK